MITVTVRVGEDETGPAEVICAPSICEAVLIAQVRYPEEKVRVVYPIDGEAFFSKRYTRDTMGRLQPRHSPTS